MKELLAAFSQSPVPPIQKHGEHCAAAVAAVGELAHGGCAVSKQMLARIDAEIVQAQELRRGIRHQITRRLFLPISRQGLRELVDQQHQIAVRARTVAREFALRFEAGVPDAIPLGALVDANERIVKQLIRAENELDELFATGFRGTEMALFVGLIDDLDQLESKAAEAHWATLQAARATEGDVTPVDAVVLHALINEIDAIGRAADAAARQLELLCTI